MDKVYLPEEILRFVEGKEYYIDETGMSGSSVLIFDDVVLKIQSDSDLLQNEHIMMKWLENRVPVPKIICNYKENGLHYLLMTKAEGIMSCDESYLLNPNMLITALSEAMNLLWDVDISDCPVKNNLSVVLKQAEYRVSRGIVDVYDAEPATFGKGGFKDPEDLLNWLYDNKPEEDFVLSHGDLCLPNIFIKNGKFSGFIDLGRTGIADRYQDIALCYRSLGHNFSGVYSGKSYEGFDEKMFFNALGIEPDFDKIRYYILLDELF